MKQFELTDLVPVLESLIARRLGYSSGVSTPASRRAVRRWIDQIEDQPEVQGWTHSQRVAAEIMKQIGNPDLVFALLDRLKQSVIRRLSVERRAAEAARQAAIREEMLAAEKSEKQKKRDAKRAYVAARLAEREDREMREVERYRKQLFPDPSPPSGADGRFVWG